MTKSNNFRSVMYLSLTAVIWGVAFVFQSMGNDYMQPFTFTSARSFLGCFVLIPIIVIKYFKPRFLADSDEIPIKKVPLKTTILAGTLCGLALGTATMLQQYGMKTTSAGKAGFITALYIILIPVFGLFLGKRVHFTVWIGAVASLVGLYLLCITGDFSVSAGDLLVLACAVVFAVQMMLVDHFAPQTNGVLLACIQFFVCAVFSGILALIFDHPSWQQIQDGLVPVLYTGVLSSGVAYTCQILGQRNFNPTIAAMIMSMESVISVAASFLAYKWGFLTQNQSLSAMQILGCVIMLAAVVFVQLPFDKLKRKH